MASSEEDQTLDQAAHAILPIGIKALLGGSVEGARLEFKATWDEAVTGWQILKTLCAFANDLQNLNGGYIVIGAAEENGVVVRPVKGLEPSLLDEVQKWIRGHCNRIEPAYMPVMAAPLIDGQRLLVLWASASDIRPHMAPDGPKAERKYWVRIGSETVETKGEIRTRLMQQTARVPFDDRKAFDATNEDLRISLAREFLHDVGSELADEPDAERIYSSMQVTRRQNGHTVPRNIGLLFFSDNPQQWFRGARIEIAEFADDAGGDTIEEKIFKGPLTHQLRSCLAWLESMTTRHLRKQSSAPEAKSWVSYPLPALREALVNAVYHRSYEADVVEPTKIYLYPNRVEIISYPGPVDGVEMAHVLGEKPFPPVQARNRRIGELLKELKLAEGRGTGLPKIRRTMERNGSPSPTFDFDEKRTFFRATLPAHPEYVALTALRKHDYYKATGDDENAIRVLRQAWESGYQSASIAALLAEGIPPIDNAVTTAGSGERLRKLMQEARAAFCVLAITNFNKGLYKEANRFFADAEKEVYEKAEFASYFAATKLKLAEQQDVEPSTRQKLLNEAGELLSRALQMDAPQPSQASAWFNLGIVRRALNHAAAEVMDAFQQAVDLDPDNSRYAEELAAAKAARS